MGFEDNFDINEINEYRYIEALRHTTAHVMAQAVKELYPDVKFGIGPIIDNGFYYDFLFPENQTISDKDLKEIKKRMKKIISKNKELIRKEITRSEALELFKDQQFKIELINDLPVDSTITYYDQDGFIDLCKGPHVEKTGEIKHFNLLSVAGAYWRGDEKREQLQRIYGTVWESKEELDDYLKRLEEAEKRDHRKLGKQLDLFSIHHDEVGGGLVFWHPKGAFIRHQIETFWKEEHLKHGYEFVVTPHIAKSGGDHALWKISGHLDFYSDSMYPPMELDNLEYRLKPMNCPGHIQIYKSRVYSYKELPLRWAELGTVYRYEKPGVLHGLLRVRGFTQDDAHVFCTEEQLQDEVEKLIQFSLHILRSIGFTKFNIYLSVRDENNKEKYIGTEQAWQEATNALKKGLENQKLDYVVDEGEAVFYGPKIDIKILDALGRPWQCSTIQVDFNLPERFNMQYDDKEPGKVKKPIMLHRALLGSLERFFGVLIEHTAGNFPVWLCPVQSAIIPIKEEHEKYAEEIHKKLIDEGIRSEYMSADTHMNKRIKQSQLKKIPYQLIIGANEMESNSVSVRLRTNEDLGTVPTDLFVSKTKEIIDKKDNDNIWYK